MTPTLTILLRIAGAGLLLLSAIHLPLARHLKWREQAVLLTPLNGAIFRVHNLFIQLILVIMGLPCLLDPRVFLEPSRAGTWFSWSFAAFWAFRLYCQWFVYQKTLWRTKVFETRIHLLFTLIWLALAALFALCALHQMGRIA